MTVINEFNDRYQTKKATST